MRLTFLKTSPLVTLPTLAYFLLHYDVFRRSMLLDHTYVAILFSIFILVDILLVYLNKTEKKFNKTINALIYSAAILFWFVIDFMHNTHIVVKDYITHPYYSASILGIGFICSIITIELFLKSKRHGNYFQNVFWSILCITSLSDLILGKVEKEYEKISNTPKKFEYAKKDNKTTVLLILDEYSSPNEIYKLTKNTNELDLAKKLKNNGWTIKSTFKTKELSTIFSIASLLHYNISSDKKFIKRHDWDVHLKYYLNPPTLIKDLRDKKIRIKNYGIFQLADYNPVSTIFFFPTNFFELITAFTGIPVLFDYFKDGKLDLIRFNTSSTDEHNRYLLKCNS